MSNPPPSPESLLWAHQFKRQHGHLLKRIVDLELAAKKHECRMNPADIVKAVDEHGSSSQRLSAMELSLNHTHRMTEDLVSQMSGVRTTFERREEVDRDATKRGELLLQRVVELEDMSRLCEQDLRLVEDKADASAVGDLRMQLAVLKGEFDQETHRTRALSHSLAEIQRANAELKVVNESIHAELKSLAARPFNRDPVEINPSVGSSRVREAADNAAPERPPKRPKRSHKAKRQDGARGAARVQAKQSLAQSSIAAQEQSSTEHDGAEMLAAARSPRPQRTTRSKAAANKHGPQQPASAPNRGSELNCEMGVDPDGDDNATRAPSNRQAPRRVARKEQRTPHWTLEQAMTQGRATRRQKLLPQAMPQQKPGLGAAVSAKATAAANSASEATLTGQDLVGPKVLRSPPPSPRALRNSHTGDTIEAPRRSAPRRHISQIDDDAMLLEYGI